MVDWRPTRSFGSSVTTHLTVQIIFVSIDEPNKLALPFFTNLRLIHLLSKNVILGVVHYLREILHQIWIHLVQPLRHSSWLPNLVGDVFQNFLRHVIVFEEMQPLHRVATLQVSVHGSVDGFFHDLGRILFVQLPRQCPACSTGISRMVEVYSLFPLISRQRNFGRINHYDVIPAVIHRVIDRLVEPH